MTAVEDGFLVDTIVSAASGLGRATAMRLADEGAAVACLDVALDACQATAASITTSCASRHRSTGT